MRRTSDIDVSPSNQTFLVLVIGTIHDQTINESLEEDGSGTSTSETTT